MKRKFKMTRMIILMLCLSSLVLSPNVYAKKDKDDKQSKGPSEMAYDKANDNSSFKREEPKKNKNKEKKEKKNKKGK
jgi:hypothetical protein